MLQCSSQSDSGASISEAREIAESHRRHYTGAAIEKYELWAQGLEGDYVRLADPISH